MEDNPERIADLHRLKTLACAMYEATSKIHGTASVHCDDAERPSLVNDVLHDRIVGNLQSVKRLTINDFFAPQRPALEIAADFPAQCRELLKRIVEGGA